MLNRFITRIKKYSVKHLATGAARIYVQNADALRSVGFLENSKINVVNKRNRIEITLSATGDKKIMDTGRGPLLELKDKKTAKSMLGHEFVSVTFRMGKIVITAHGHSQAQYRREARFVDSVNSGKPLRFGSFFSGTGMLSYHLKQGLTLAGIETEIAFSNDNDELAMSCSLEGNPIWKSASLDALSIVDSIADIDADLLAEQDVVEVGYPCVGFSMLAKKERLDLEHPETGTLFIPLINLLRKMNPAVLLFENTPRFGSSKTFELIKRSFPDYHFTQEVFSGQDYGELESRKRVCIVAVSKGLPSFDLSMVNPVVKDSQSRVQDFLVDVPLNSDVWSEMHHVKARDNMKHLGYKNCLYFGNETKMVTLPASYACTKAGSPMIAHPIQPNLQRKLLVEEHVKLRELPGTLADVILSVKNGTHSLVSKRGNGSACHRMLGNGVSRRVWTAVGYYLGLHFSSMKYGAIV
jgi:DNA (cytosine-5)-methyltransferase 1